jgi:hypothetical protein
MLAIAAPALNASGLCPGQAEKYAAGSESLIHSQPCSGSRHFHLILLAMAIYEDYLL